MSENGHRFALDSPPWLGKMEQHATEEIGDTSPSLTG
jgi:hypothetical protein